MPFFLLLATFLLALSGALLLWWSRRTLHSTGLPSGRVVYSDTGKWRSVAEPLVSREFGLVGKPDYLVDGPRGTLIPVEVKSRKRPAAPFDSHILQLGAYCLLVETTFDRRPSHGLLHYADATLNIPFSNELRARVIATVEAIAEARTARSVHRQHGEAARCRRCGYAHACGDERLG